MFRYSEQFVSLTSFRKEVDGIGAKNVGADARSLAISTVTSAKRAHSQRQGLLQRSRFDEAGMGSLSEDCRESYRPGRRARGKKLLSSGATGWFERTGYAEGSQRNVAKFSG